VFLAVILVAEIGAAIAAYVLKDGLQEEVANNMKKGMQNYNKTGYEGVTTTWDHMQADLHCCGVQNFTDWSKPENNNGVIPDSCCVNTKDGGQIVGCGADKTEEKYKVGCLDKLDDIFMKNIDKIGGAALGIAFVQLLGVIMACCIGKRIRDQGEFV